MSRFGDYIAFWRNWDDQERSTAKVVAGLLTGVLCLFILISCVSYLFHWQQDMSLLGDPSMMDSATEVGNAAGKLGYSSLFKPIDGGYVTDDHFFINTIARIPAIDIVPYLPNCKESSFGPTWHTTHDNIENIDKNVLEAVGKTLMEVIYNEKP